MFTILLSLLLGLGGLHPMDIGGGPVGAAAVHHSGHLHTLDTGVGPTG